MSKTQIILGLKDSTVGRASGTSLVQWTVADGAQLRASEQDKNNIPEKDHYAAVYEADPVVADRNILVDQDGRFYETDNPLPVRLSDGSVNIGTVNAEIQVQVSHRATVQKPVPDSVRIGDGTNELAIRPDGSANVNVQNALVKDPYNDIEVTYNADGTTNQLIYRMDATVVATFTLQYDAQQRFTRIVPS